MECYLPSYSPYPGPTSRLSTNLPPTIPQILLQDGDTISSMEIVEGNSLAILSVSSLAQFDERQCCEVQSDEPKIPFNTTCTLFSPSSLDLLTLDWRRKAAPTTTPERMHNIDFGRVICSNTGGAIERLNLKYKETVLVPLVRRTRHRPTRDLRMSWKPIRL